jgi:small conductance mechanosensitive channel
MSTTRKLQVLAFAAIGCFPSSAVSAQDAANASADLTNHANKAVTNIMETVSLAIKGNPEAQQILLKDYLANALLVIAVTLISYMVASWIGRFIGGVVTKKVDLTLGKFLSKAIRNLIMIVVAMVALEMNDVNVAGFAAILAAMGFAIGMALQGTLGNFAAGIMLLVFRPFKVDDYILVADTEGTVEEIDLFTTRLNALDNRHLIIPNGEIFGSKLENYSRNSVRRVDVNVGAAYSADLEQTRAALERAVASVRSDSDAPAPQVYLLELGASSVDWQLRVWCHPKNYWEVRENLTAAAKKSLDMAGISIPYPQLDIHVAGKLLAKAA